MLKKPKKTRFQIIDAINRVHGPFKTPHEMVAYTRKRFRHQRQDDERKGRYPTGYDVQVVGAGNG